MDENDVVNTVCEHLEAQGFVILQRLSTIEKGIDIIAKDSSSGCKLFVEAKGGTSSRKGSARFGKPHTQAQVFNRVAKGVFTCLQLRANTLTINYLELCWLCRILNGFVLSLSQY